MTEGPLAQPEKRKLAATGEGFIRVNKLLSEDGSPCQPLPCRIASSLAAASWHFHDGSCEADMYPSMHHHMLGLNKLCRKASLTDDPLDEAGVSTSIRLKPAIFLPQKLLKWRNI